MVNDKNNKNLNSSPLNSSQNQTTKVNMVRNPLSSQKNGVNSVNKNSINQDRTVFLRNSNATYVIKQNDSNNNLHNPSVNTQNRQQNANINLQNRQPFNNIRNGQMPSQNMQNRQQGNGVSGQKSGPKLVGPNINAIKQKEKENQNKPVNQNQQTSHNVEVKNESAKQNNKGTITLKNSEDATKKAQIKNAKKNSALKTDEDGKAIITIRKRITILTVVMISTICLALGMVFLTYKLINVDRKGSNILSIGSGLEIDMDNSKLSIELQDAISDGSTVLSVVDKLHFTKTVESNSMYARFTIGFKSNSANPEVQKALDEINSNFFDSEIFKPKINENKNYGWTYSAGYYYLVSLNNGKPTNFLRPITDTTDFIICDDYKVSMNNSLVLTLEKQDITLELNLEAISSKIGNTVYSWLAEKGIEWNRVINEKGEIGRGVIGAAKWELYKSKTDEYDKAGTSYRDCLNKSGEFYVISQGVIENLSLIFDDADDGYRESSLREYLQSSAFYSHMQLYDTNSYLDAIESVSCYHLTGEQLIGCMALTDKFFVLSMHEIENDFSEIKNQFGQTDTWWTRTSANNEKAYLVDGTTVVAENKNVSKNVKVAFKIILP